MLDRAVWARVNLGNIRQNIREIKTKVKNGAKFCAVVKADAYGHGAVAVAKAAEREGVDYFAVAILNEALELRRAGFLQPILILGCTPPEQSRDLVACDIEPTVFTMEAAQALSAAAVLQNKTAKLHLAVDTGMSRIGAAVADVGELARRIAALPGLKIEGLFSHFAKADYEDKTFAHVQLERFREAIRRVESAGVDVPIRHIANSAAILELPEAHFDMVRAGIVLYGLWPSDEVKRTIALRPAMQLQTKVSYVKRLPAGTGIGYGQIYTLARESAIATLPIGYADGWTRLLTGKAKADFNGRLAPIVGKICMDQCMADVTGLNVKIGDVATLFGSSRISVDDVAAWLGTINYEVVCMVGKRVPRVYCEEENAPLYRIYK